MAVFLRLSKGQNAVRKYKGGQLSVSWVVVKCLDNFTLFLEYFCFYYSCCATMGAVTYRDGIAILQLIVFPFVVAAALFIWKRTGWRIGSKIWRFAVTLGLIRIAGSICSLLTISHDSYNVEVAVAVCELIGIAPLLLTYVGILRQM